MKDNDKNDTPYITIAKDLGISEFIQKSDEKDFKILESPFSDIDNEDKEDKK